MQAIAAPFLRRLRLVTNIDAACGGSTTRSLASVLCSTRLALPTSARRRYLPLMNPRRSAHNIFTKYFFYLWNRYSRERAEEVGPDRAAAEWVLRCGGYIRWRGHTKFTTDYKSLPLTDDGWFIEAIDASDSCVDDQGFDHLVGLRHVKQMKLSRVTGVTDVALRKLERLRDSLQYLEIVGCSMVTDDGLRSLETMKGLKKLVLYDLPGVRDRERCIRFLRLRLPQCDVRFPAIDVNRPLEL